MPPSWVTPIAIGAVFAFVVGGLPMLFTGARGPDSVGLSCCCGMVLFVPFGFLPAFLALRRDPYTTPGQGFTVAFIAVGIGQILWAIMQSLGIDSDSIAEFESQLREFMQAANQEQPADRRLAAEDLDAVVESVVRMLPYLPVFTAGIVSLLSGLVGLFSVAVFRSRRPPEPG